ncbi:hypothetical protein ABZW03_21990 [Kitasatospora sp. NPDC004799]|uniref:hypothetical protein n=1 Tax=Kitasatospora sp. NPDC004799 TaxID=3154460 RepID=UPI0033BAE278
MPGTRHLGGGRTGRAARRLAAALFVPALLVPVLAACGGGGGDSGAAGQNGGSEQPDDQRTKDEGNQGGFRNAGQPSANVQGTDNTARITLSFPSKASFTATISKVADCGSTAYATPASQRVQVTDGETERVTFLLPHWKSGTKSRTICLTVAADDSTKRIEAVGSVQIISPDEESPTGYGSTPGGGTSPGYGSTPGGGSSPGGGPGPYGGSTP